MREEVIRSRESMMSTQVVEEEKGVLKSGLVTVGFAPVKTKKQYYAVLCERALELHESEKTYKKRKAAKHLIDLSVSFNVGNDHYDVKLKRCVCLMGPDETLVLKGDNDIQSSEWYEAILSAMIPARALRLGRPVLPFEFFEFCWDVDIVVCPKLKKPVRMDESLPNMCSKVPGLPGPKRLCFYAHTIVLSKRKIEPAIHNVPESGIPPFQVDDFIELQRNVVATFGCQEKYFLMRMGRSSPMGACELWCLCESDEVASDIHDKLNRIIDREAEKKKKMGNGPLPPGMLHARSHGHRERSHTQPMRPRTASSAQGGNEYSPSSAPSSACNSARERRARLRDCKAMIDSFEEEAQRSLHARRDSRPSITTQHPASFTLDLTRRVGSPASFSGSIGRKPSTGTPINLGFGNPFGVQSSSNHSNRIGSVGNTGYHINTPQPSGIFATARRPSESIKEENSSYQSMGLMGPPSDWKKLSPSTSATEETEDSGGTLRLDAASFHDPDSISCNSRRSIAVEATIERRRGSKEMSSSEDGDELLSVGGTGSVSTGPGSTSTQDQEEYAPMDAAEWSLSDSGGHLHVPQCEKYQLEEVRSYVSDSSDSCYSSMAANGSTHGGASSSYLPTHNNSNPPRAYSFGARTATTKPVCATGIAGISGGIESGSSLLDHKEAAVATARQSGGGLMPPPEDPRKRAFSLGSKSFFQRPFRKLSQHASSRQTRHSQTSASGASLASSSNASSIGPPSSSSTNQIAALGGENANDAYRNRSGSFGSGRSTPFNRRGFSGSDKLGGASRDHLVEIDFGGLGTSGSGSVHSVDSPSRSRTSSFGCKTEFTGLTILGDSYDQPRPSELLLQQAARQMREEEAARAKENEGEYVMTNAVNVAALQAACQAAEEVGQVCYSGLGALSPPDPKLLDIRQSQLFETIQETASGKSSRCSSRSSLHAPEEHAPEDDYTLMEVNTDHMTKEEPVHVSQPAKTCAYIAYREPVKTQKSITTEPEIDVTKHKCEVSLNNGQYAREKSKGDSNDVVNSSSSSSVGEIVPIEEETAADLQELNTLQIEPPGKTLGEQRTRSAVEATIRPEETATVKIPKRNSVPALLTDEPTEEGDPKLNYAFLQMSVKDNGGGANNFLTPKRVSRARSKSGVVVRGAEQLTSAASATHPPGNNDYTVLK